MALKRFPAELEYKRNPQLSKEAVQSILVWVQNQPHLPKIEEEDAIMFLVSCKLDVEYAKKTIDLHYTFRTQHPELFCDRDPLGENFKLDCRCGQMLALPGLTLDGYKAVYSKILKNSDLSKFDHQNEAKFYTSLHDLMQYEEGALPGWRVIFDMSDMKFSLILKLRPSIISNMMYYFQEANPIQLIGIHIVHPKSYVTYFTNLLKPFLKKSAADFLQVHSNLEELYKYVSKKNLPLECGGEQPSVEETSSITTQMVIENRELLIHIESLRVQETLRPKEETKGFWRHLWG